MKMYQNEECDLCGSDAIPCACGQVTGRKIDIPMSCAEAEYLCHADHEELIEKIMEMDKELVRLQQNEATMISAMMRILRHDKELGGNRCEMQEFRGMTEIITTEALGIVKENR